MTSPTCRRCEGPCVTITGRIIETASLCEPCAQIIGARSARPLGEVTLLALAAMQRLGRPVTAREVSEACEVAPARVTTVLCKGANRGTVERVGKTRDGNRILWRLTETGEAAVERAREQVPGVVARLAEAVGMEALAI
jgi:DNA-binding MarR family transcriptional regulator